MNERKMRLVYIFADYISTLVGVMVFTFVRFMLVSDIRACYAEMSAFFGSYGLKLTMSLFPLFMLGLYYLSGFYVNVTNKSRVKEFLSTGMSVAIGAFIFFMVVLLNDVLPRRVMNYEILLVFFVCLFVPVYITRLVLTSLWISRWRGSKLENVVVISGSDTCPANIADIIERSNKCIRSVISVDGQNSDLQARLSVRRLVTELRDTGATAFVVALPSDDPGLSLRVLGCLYPLDRAIYVSPDDYMLLVSKVPYDNLLSEPLVDISRSSLSDSIVSMKRASDVAGALVGLLLAAPVIGVLTLAIKFKSPGPVFYSQERIGYHRKPFKIYKLRTMTVNAESSGPALSSDNDPRVTNVGRFMRKYRLDELPNLWNVLRGDMSLVGPRPEREYFLGQLRLRAPHCALLHQVRPGLTSLGMVKFGYASTVDDMLARMKYDLLYIQNISVSPDLKVIFYTVRTIFRGEGK